MACCPAIAKEDHYGKPYGQYAVGIRAGDPMGFSVIEKRENHAFEFNIGMASFAGLFNYYERNFNRWRGFDDYTLEDYRVNHGGAMQLHYLMYHDLSDGLKWYVGGGGQIRWFSIKYWYDVTYQDLATHKPVTQKWSATSVEKDLGLDGVIGVDYQPDGFPLNLFLDITPFVELWENPGMMMLQAGIGVRYVLN